MKFSNNISYIVFLIVLILGSNIIFAQGSNNYCFVFNGTTSELSLLDDETANEDAYSYLMKMVLIIKR
ncbi:MAG: hypothetical protein P8X73_05350 [Ignavibacteriaceae bacterium]